MVTAEFATMMSSSGVLPLITHPNRVTATSATVINNIFTMTWKTKVSLYRDFVSLMYQIIFQFFMFQSECNRPILISICAKDHIFSTIRNSLVMFLQPDGRTDGWADGQTERHIDRQTNRD